MPTTRKITSFTLKGPKLIVHDPTYGLATTDSVTVELPPGRFTVEVDLVPNKEDGGFVVGAFRMRSGSRKGTSRRLLGRVVVDAACVVFYDLEAFKSAFENDPRAYFRHVEPLMDRTDLVLAGHLPRKKSLEIALCYSGYGDGTYPIYELRHDGRRIGIEAQFIRTKAA